MRNVHEALFLAAAACLAWSLPSLAMTDEECATMWKQADVDNDGSLREAEARRYAAWMRVKDKSVLADSTIEKAQFLENCKSNVFTTAAVDAGDRVLAAGFSDVSALTKDDKGIWRGTAKKASKSVKVAVDYRGNVVAN